jgi:hypothetical protein
LRFAKTVFSIAGFWGILFLVPTYFLYDTIGRTYPPPINHPEWFYAFLGVTLGWQFAFFVIASDPARYRPFMLLGVYEKVSYIALLLVLLSHHRIVPGQLVGAVPDAILACFFIAAYAKSQPRIAASAAR